MEPAKGPPAIVTKFGEVTHQKMYQVRGDQHWYSSPQIALDTHNRVKQFYANGGYGKKNENDQRKKR